MSSLLHYFYITFQSRWRKVRLFKLLIFTFLHYAWKNEKTAQVMVGASRWRITWCTVRKRYCIIYMYVYFFSYFFQNYNTYISICVLFAFLRGGWVGGREGMGGRGKERPGGERPLFPGHNGRVSSSAIGLDAASPSLNQPTHNSFLFHNRSNFLCLSVCLFVSVGISVGLVDLMFAVCSY